MNFFECCHHCKPPKRYSGCHDTCLEYLGQRKKLDEHNALINQKRHEASLNCSTRFLKSVTKKKKS